MLQFLIHAFEKFRNATGSADHNSIHMHEHVVFKEVHIVIFSVMVLLIYMSPLLIFGENSHVTYHDNLDSGVVWYKVLAESGQIFGTSNTIIPNIMGGLPRFSYPSEFNLIVWLFYFFRPFPAYMINQFILHTIAFWGMYIFLKRHFLTSQDNNSFLIRSGVSLTYSLIPFLPLFGHSIVTFPLALWAFMNIRNNDISWKNWFIIVLITLYSSLIYSYLFFISLVGLLWVIDSIKTKKINYKFLFSIILMTLIFVFEEYRLFYIQFFNQGFISQRAEWNLFKNHTITGSINEFISSFLFGHEHAKTYHTYVILPITILGIWLVKRKNSMNKLEDENFFINKLIINTLILITIISFIFGFSGYFNIINIIPFQLRFYWLYPLLWYFIFALSLNSISKNIKNIKLRIWIIVIALSVQSLLLFYKTDWIRGVLKESYKKINKAYIASPTYCEFFSEKLFKEIDNYIGKAKNSYRVASIGIHPSIAAYNGFYTLDGYMVYYPLEYKHKFRKIIEKELYKNKIWKDYYDDWGNRVYIFVDEIEKKRDDPKWDWYMLMETKCANFNIKNLELDIDSFKKMGGKYIFSAVKIINCKSNGISLEKIFYDKNLPWKIYLYRAKD